MLGSIPISDVQQQVTQHQQNLIDIFYSYGALRKKSANEIVNVGSALNPKRIPKAEYERLQNNCLSFNDDLTLLYNRFDSLREFFVEYSKGDALTAILFDILKRAEALGKQNDKPVGLIVRNDLMYDVKMNEFKQVEFNNMSCGLGQLTTKLGDLMRHFYDGFLYKPLNWIKSNNCDRQIETFLKLYELYGNSKAVFVVVMLDNEPNIFDSIPNERALKLAGVPVRRLTLSQITKNSFEIDKTTRKLFVQGEEVAIVYFRSLYDPSHFTEERINFWATAEASRAIMLPDIKWFILGIKLTQLLLSSKPLLAEYDLEQLKNSPFSPHYCQTMHLNSDFGGDRNKMLAYAQEHQKQLLIKALEEGGAGLILGDEAMLKYIETADIHDLQKVLLAYRIDAPLSESLVLFQHELRVFPETTSEISVYTSLILTPESGEYKKHHSTVWDYLLRSKAKNEIKGGMNIGASYMDTLVYE